MSPFLCAAVHHFVEFNVSTMLESDMAHAFLTPSNEGMTATDTQVTLVQSGGVHNSELAH